MRIPCTGRVATRHATVPPQGAPVLLPCRHVPVSRDVTSGRHALGTRRSRSTCSPTGNALRYTVVVTHCARIVWRPGFKYHPSASVFTPYSGGHIMHPRTTTPPDNLVIFPEWGTEAFSSKDVVTFWGPVRAMEIGSLVTLRQQAWGVM